MSSDGNKHKPTQGWAISSNGEMALGSNKMVVIDEPPQPPEPRQPTSPTAKTEVAGAAPEPQRARRTTLDLFNDEMAVMDRPIEGDVEYLDEKPPSRWRGVAAFCATVALVGGGGAFLISHHRSAVAAQSEASRPATAAAQAPALPPVAALQPGAVTAPAAPTEAPAAVAPAPDEEEDAVADGPSEDTAAVHHAASRTAWTKVHSKATSHSKHARSGGGKTTYRRTTTVKRHTVVKRTAVARR
jgi:hypothetical protein